MPIQRVLWFDEPGGHIDASRDRHVLRTQTSDGLISGRNLMFEVAGVPKPVLAGEHFSTQSDVDLQFRPLFRAADAGTRFSGFGIHVDNATGVVSFDAGPRPANAPRSFLLEVSVTRNVGGPDIDPLLIRIHAHETVTRFSLTPSDPGFDAGHLTVHRQAAAGKEETPFRFGARAEFDDPTLGDVTLHLGSHGRTRTMRTPKDSSRFRRRTRRAARSRSSRQHPPHGECLPPRAKSTSRPRGTRCLPRRRCS